jgi:hypothetical protein
MKYSVFIASLVLFTGFFSTVQAQLASSLPLSGHAWSSTIGWVSFSGPGYEVEIETDGSLDGYAWSSHIGWIKFGGLSDFPGSGGNASLDTATNQITGWARACAGTASGDCSTMTDHIDGWDGWISLSCENTDSCAISTYEVIASGGVLSGYAWGSDVVGWLRFSGSGYGVVYTTPCSPTLQCLADGTTIEQVDQWCTVVSTSSCSPDICLGGSCVADNPTGSITATPPVARRDGTVVVNWSSEDASSCTVEQQNAAGTASQSWVATSSNETSAPINRQVTIFSLQCTSSGNPALEEEIASTTVSLLSDRVET